MPEIFEIEKLAFDLIETNISEQKADLRNLRNQAAIVSAVNGLVATFASGVTYKVLEIRTGSNTAVSESIFFGMNLATLLAVLAFSVSLVFSLKILVPTSGWKFDHNVTKIVERFGDHQDCKWAYKKLAISREKNFIQNERKLREEQTNLLYSVCAAAIQLPFWLLNLVSA